MFKVATTAVRASTSRTVASTDHVSQRLTTSASGYGEVSLMIHSLRGTKTHDMHSGVGLTVALHTAAVCTFVIQFHP